MLPHVLDVVGDSKLPGITRHYVLIEVATGRVLGCQSVFTASDLTVPSPVDGATLLKELTNEEVEATPLRDYVLKKKAVIADGEFHHWIDKHSGLNCTISAAPKNDGSNTPYISLVDGLPNSAYKAVASTGVALNSQATGTLNGTGDAAFRVKITDGSIVLGSVMISPDGHDDFGPVSFSFNVVAGDF